MSLFYLLLNPEAMTSLRCQFHIDIICSQMNGFL